MTKIDEFELPGNLRQALKAYGDARRDMAADLDVRDARQQVIMTSHLLDKANAELAEIEADYRKKLDELRPYIVGQVLELEGPCEHAGVEVKYRKGYVRMNWDGKALAKLETGAPKVWQKILSARSITEVEPSVTVVD